VSDTTQRPIPFERGYHEDWQIRPANYIQLDWLAHMRNFIHIWLPEGVTTSNVDKPIFILREEVDFHFFRESPDYWVHTFEKPGVISLRSECLAIPDGVALALELTNLSPDDWEDVQGGVCVQLIAAPDFADCALERTFGVTDGRRIPPVQPDRSTPWSHHFRMRESSNDNFIAVASREPGYVVAQWWEGEPVNIGGNSDPSIACIHCQPGFGRIASGATKRREGRLYLMPGTIEDAYQRYRDEIQSMESGVIRDKTLRY